MKTIDCEATQEDIDVAVARRKQGYMPSKCCIVFQVGVRMGLNPSGCSFDRLSIRKNGESIRLKICENGQQITHADSDNWRYFVGCKFTLTYP